MNTIQEEQTASPEIEPPPVSYDEAKLERLVFATPPGLGEPIKKKTRQPNREYMRDYYHKNKKDTICPFCNMTYTCKSSLVKHQRRSTKCAIQRIHRTFSDFTEADCRIRDYLHKHEMEEQLKLLQRLANKNKKQIKTEMT